MLARLTTATRKNAEFIGVIISLWTSEKMVQQQ